MKHFTLIMFVALLGLVGLTGCDKPITGDDDGDKVDAWDSWETVDDCITYEPSVGYPPYLLWLSHGQIQEIQCLLEQEPTTVFTEEIGRDICSTSKWVLDDYTKPHKYSPFKFYAGGVKISSKHSVTLKLVTVHEPKRKPPQIWVPNYGEDPDNPYVADDPDTWGHWE